MPRRWMRHRRGNEPVQRTLTCEAYRTGTWFQFRALGPVEDTSTAAQLVQRRIYPLLLPGWRRAATGSSSSSSSWCAIKHQSADEGRRWSSSLGGRPTASFYSVRGPISSSFQKQAEKEEKEKKPVKSDKEEMKIKYRKFPTTLHRRRRRRRRKRRWDEKGIKRVSTLFSFFLSFFLARTKLVKALGNNMRTHYAFHRISLIIHSLCCCCWCCLSLVSLFVAAVEIAQSSATAAAENKRSKSKAKGSW